MIFDKDDVDWASYMAATDAQHKVKPASHWEADLMDEFGPQADTSPHSRLPWSRLDSLPVRSRSTHVLLAIEQSCDNGVLMPWDMRGVRLQSLPPATLAQLHWLLGACPRHVLVHLVHYVYWVMRSERARRRGSPEWSPSMPIPPLPWWEEDEPAFKPMQTWLRRWP